MRSRRVRLLLLAVLAVGALTAVGLRVSDRTKGSAAAAPWFAGPKLYPLTETDTQGLAVGDLNGDGAAEVVMPIDLPGREGIAVYGNGGDGHLLPPRHYAATDDPQAVEIGDLNGDGKPDVVV